MVAGFLKIIMDLLSLKIIVSLNNISLAVIRKEWKLGVTKSTFVGNIMNKKIKVNFYGSSCCKSPMRIEGRTTMYYVCDKCNKPCDKIKIGYKLL